MPNAQSPMPLKVIAVFDIGKTNKKLFLFDEGYNIVFEKSIHFNEIQDEDGEPCENLAKLIAFINDTFDELRQQKEFVIRAINFAGYGASFVYVDDNGKPVAPLYSYLKAYPEKLKKKFYNTYGGEINFSFKTASPVLGSLNSGMQLYRIKYENPALFGRIKYVLHLPQFVSFLLTGKACADMTSIGCHTNLWDFEKNDYHDWVREENLLEKFPPILPSTHIVSASISGHTYPIGVGLHDSSAALIPYLVSFQDPFVLISTGTWCISLNPFNHAPLTQEELACDCLCYLQYNGKPVKASRLFAGHLHDQEVERISKYFNKPLDYFKSVHFNPGMVKVLKARHDANAGNTIKSGINETIFSNRKISDFATEDEAYHQLMYDLMVQQYASTQLVLRGTKVKRIFVDGGFGKNQLYMNLLAIFFPAQEVYAASVAQATAMGAALAIHQAWNTTPIPKGLIELKYYEPAK